MIRALLSSLLALAGLALCSSLCAQEIAWSLKYDPKTFDSAKVDDQALEMVRYLTGGVLLRLNRTTQQVDPALASSWSVSPDGRLVTFHLRDHLRFSNGEPLTSADVVATLKRILDPATQAPVAEEFIDAAAVSVTASDPRTVQVHLPKRIVAIDKGLRRDRHRAGRQTRRRTRERGSLHHRRLQTQTVDSLRAQPVLLAARCSGQAASVRRIAEA
jgi:ABC-type transport system substrate-binding protein